MSYRSQLERWAGVGVRVKSEGPRSLCILANQRGLSQPLSCPVSLLKQGPEPEQGLKSDKRQNDLESARKYIHFQENYIVVEKKRKMFLPLLPIFHWCRSKKMTGCPKPTCQAARGWGAPGLCPVGLTRLVWSLREERVWQGRCQWGLPWSLTASQMGKMRPKESSGSMICSRL